MLTPSRLPLGLVAPACTSGGVEEGVTYIGPRTTGMGDVQKLHTVVRALRPDVRPTLVHHSFSSVTGRGERTAPQRKDVELWFSAKLGDRWAVRDSVD